MSKSDLNSARVYAVGASLEKAKKTNQNVVSGDSSIIGLKSVSSMSGAKKPTSISRTKMASTQRLKGLDANKPTHKRIFSNPVASNLVPVKKEIRIASKLRHNFHATNFMSNPYLEKKPTKALRISNVDGDKGSVASLENVAEQGQRRRRSDRASASAGSQASQHSKKSLKRSRLDRTKIKQNKNASFVKKPTVIRD